jgi:hypothetical protein
MHMISLSTPLSSTTLLSLWLLRPVLAQQAQHSVFRGDRIDVHVLWSVIPGEPLQHLRVPQNDVQVLIDDVQALEADQHPGSHAGFRALSPIGRFRRGNPEAVYGTGRQR